MNFAAYVAPVKHRLENEIDYPKVSFHVLYRLG